MEIFFPFILLLVHGPVAAIILFLIFAWIIDRKYDRESRY